MRIVCPNCHATYEVPEAKLVASTRAVRCARCGTEWHPEPAAQPPIPRPPLESPPPAQPFGDDDEAPPTILLPRPSASQSGPIPTEPPAAPGRGEPKLSSYRPRTVVADDSERLPPRDYESVPARRSALIGWVLTVVLLALIAWGAVAFRSQVMAAWPPSERVYLALGLR